MHGLYIIEDVNPEPWTPGQIGFKNGRKFMYKDSKLTAFQKAVKEQIKDHYPGTKLFEGSFVLDIWFWRSSADGNQSDRTNLYKATEDALQGVLYDNDRLSLAGWSEIVEQSPNTEPKIIIEIRAYEPGSPPKVSTPTQVARQRTDEQDRRADYNPAEDF